MRRLFVLTLVVALGAPPAAAGPSPSPGSPQAPSTAAVPAGIVRLLDDRGKAFTTHDRDLLSRTLVPGEFQAMQLAAFDAASALSFDVFRFRATTQFSGDLASPRVKALYPGREAAAYQVEEESEIGGVERVPYVEDDFFTFVRNGAAPDDPYEGWRLGSASDFELLGGFSAVHMWDAGPVDVAKSEHFLLLAHPDRIGKVRPALDMAEQALVDDQKFWPRPIDARYVILAPSTLTELGDIIHSTVDLTKFTAFAAGTDNEENGFQPEGVRIFLQLEHFERYNDAGKRTVLGHELIHAITRPLSGPFFPTWIEEGLAMFGSEHEDGLPVARRAGPPDAFPSDDKFFVGPTGDIVLTYYRAQTAIGTLVRRSGADGLERFYEALGRARLDPGTKDYHVREALKESVGWTVEEWTRAWRERLR